MKNQDLKKIEKVVKTNRLVADRVKRLRYIGFTVSSFSMGSGGVLQQKKMRNGTTRIQIGYGHGANNYAMAVVL